VLFTALFLALGLLLVGDLPVSAQACATDAEPNNVEAEAQTVPYGCMTGTLTGGDQDLFRWTVAGAEVTPRQLVVSGLPDQALTVQLYTFPDPAAGTPAKLTELSFAPGGGEKRLPLLLAAGDYLLGVAGSGAGAYQIGVEPFGNPSVPEQEPNEDVGTAMAVRDLFAVSGAMLADYDYYQWTVTAAQAGTPIRLALLSPPTGSVSLAMERISDGVDLVYLSSSNAAGYAVIDNLILAAGEYRLWATGYSDTPIPYLLQTSAGPAVTEVEPNDLATVNQAIGAESLEITGVFGLPYENDYFRLTVDNAFATQLWTLRAERTTDDGAPATVTLCLAEQSSSDIQCREGAGAELVDFSPPPGDYLVRVAERRNAGGEYRLTLQPEDAVDPDAEREPNDLPAYASVIGERGAIKGRLVGAESDFFTFAVTGEPQLWRVQVTGDGLEILAYANQQGQELMRRSAEEGRRIRLENLYLLPGNHTFQVRGVDGSYALRLIPLGPPVAEPVSAESGPANPDVPVDSGPPAVAVTEREPNDRPDLALLLPFGQLQSGRLAEGDDADLYRFYLPGAAHVRLSVQPPADQLIETDLGNLVANGNQGAGASWQWQGLLPPGDYFVSLTPSAPSDGVYRLLLEQLDFFALPVDQEPANNQRETALPVPASLAVTGSTTGQRDDYEDWYLLPGSGSAAELTVSGAGVIDDLRLWQGEKPLGNYNSAAQEITVDLAGDKLRSLLNKGDGPEAGVADLALQVRARGAYTLTLRYKDGPQPVAAAPSPVTVAIGAPPPLAAYYPQAQRLLLPVTLTNSSAASVAVTLAVATGDVRVTAELPAAGVPLAAGATQLITVPLQILPDLAGGTVSVAVQATANVDGGGTAVGPVSAPTAIEVVCGAPPAGANHLWSTAGPLRGGINVADWGLGARSTLADDESRWLLDGIVSPSTGINLRPQEEGPFIIDLAGAAPIVLAGVALHPQGRVLPPDTLRDFAVAASSDGVTFSPVLTASLSLAPIEQWFSFAEPVAATHLQVTLINAHRVDFYEIGLGSFKAIAQPVSGVDQALGGFDLASGRLGGHVVFSVPQIEEYGRPLLNDEIDTPVSYIDRNQRTTAEWVVGFQHNRAALIDRLDWQWTPGGNPAERAGQVNLFVSNESPTGPWLPLATWTLDPASDEVQQLTLDTAQWARFLRFELPFVAEGYYAALPETLRVWEKAEDPAYSSILAEYGHNARAAIYEQQQAVIGLGSQIGEADNNDSRTASQQLQNGQQVRGTVQTAVDEDWYRIEVAEPFNTIVLAIAGDPALTASAELFDVAGTPVEAAIDRSGNLLQVRATVAPGSYLLHLAEPRRSVIFTWDTSGSVSAYEYAIAQSLFTFAQDVNPELEMINLIPFGEPNGPLLMEEWSGDRNAILYGLNNYTGGDDSSNAEGNLLAAVNELGNRAGTRAIVLLTDAESNGYPLAPELWQRLGEVQPRIFAYEVSSSGSDYAQDLMQDWADVNAGQYGAWANVGEMEMAFARASCSLRRPGGYLLDVTLANEAPPTPTPSPTPAPTATPTATPTPAPTPTPAAPGSIQVTSPAAGGEEAPVAGNVAVELILDASGSMLQSLDGKPRIQIARETLTDLVNNVLPRGVPLALRVFGNREADSCRTDLEAPLQPLDPAAMSELIANINAVNLARTPIGESLRLVAEDLAGAGEFRLVVLVTDGEETCDGDPAAAIDALRAAGFDVRVNIVGFAVDDAALQATFEEWAKRGGGVYINAANAAELGAAVTQAVRAPFRVLDAGGAVVAEGFVGGDRVAVPAGSYTVEIISAEVQRLAVIVNGGEAVVVAAR
jgi:hypothetical protein